MGRHLTIGLGILLIVPLALMVACEGGIGGPTPAPTPTKAEIAEAAAREWVSASIGKVSDDLIDFAYGEVPVVSRLAGDVLVECPSSRPADEVRRVLDGREDFACNVAFEATYDLALAQSLRGAATHVFPGPGIVTKPDQDDAV